MERIIRILAQAVLPFIVMLVMIPFATAQTCRWDGTAPICNGSCGGNETEVTRLDAIPDFWVPPFVNQNPSFGESCVTGTKALCCATVGSTCRWDGTAPFCDGSCRSDETQSTPPPGSSSGAACVTGSKVFCCKKFGTTKQKLVEQDCTYGRGTCARGYVWREAIPSDHVCVPPQVRDDTRRDNAQAATRRNPAGGPYGPDTCLSGFVWREAYQGDHVCVTPRVRSQAAQDNRWANIRNACP